MRGRLRRIAAIVRADVSIRFRRQSTLVLFLALGFVAYWSVPDPSTGTALMIVEDGRRALYDSAALGMATAVLASIFVGLAGYYVVSNAIGRDLATRCGSVIAATTVGNGEYIVGKFLGNAAFLTMFTAGFMVVSSGMLVVRGEAPLDPWIFVQSYLLLTPPAIVFAAALAILFESVPGLSGRGGDVAFFFLWLIGISVVAALSMGGAGAIGARYLDFAGLGMVAQQILPTLESPNLSIGGTFDPAKPLYVFPGLSTEPSWVLARLVSVAMPLPLLAVARWAFHRFDPARVRVAADRERAARLARAHSALAALTRRVSLPAFVPEGPPWLVSAMADARVTLVTNPMILPVAVGAAIATAVGSTQSFLRVVLPLVLALAGILTADSASRDSRLGTLDLLYSMPLVRRGLVWWKLLGSVLASSLILTVPLARLAVTDPTLLPAFANGVFLVLGVGTSLGVLVGSSKAFTVVLLSWMYLVTSDGGRMAALDFAGFYGQATGATMTLYATVTIGSLVVAHAVHGARLR